MIKLSKKITLGLLLLNFAVLFGGCSTFSNLLSESNSKNSETNKNSEPDSLRQEKEKEINKLNTELTRQQAKLDEEKKECDGMTKDTITQKKDPKNQKEAPQTFAQCQKAALMQTTIEELKGKIEKANQELSSLPVIPESPAKTAGQDNSNIIYLLLFGFTGIVGLSFLGGLYYLLNNKIKEESILNQKSFGDVRKKHNEFQRLIDQLSETAKFQHEKLERHKLIIQALQNQPSSVAAAQSQQFAEQPVYKPEPQFPVSVENYLNKVQIQGQKASADMIGGLLVQDPNKNQEFLVVKDSALADGLFYAVPSFARFSTKSEYLTYYQHYYACENPSGGTVWIIVPTTVRRVADGWKLQDMGELEIRN